MTGAFFFDGLKASLCELAVLLEQERHALSIVRKLPPTIFFHVGNKERTAFLRG